MIKLNKQQFIDILVQNKQLKSIVEKEQQEVNQLSEIIKTGKQEVNRLKEKHSQNYNYVLTKAKQLIIHNDSLEEEIEKLKETKEELKETIKELENTKNSYREEIEELEEISKLCIQELFTEEDAIYEDTEEQITEEEMWEVLIEEQRRYLEVSNYIDLNIDSSLDSPEEDDEEASSISTELHPTSLSYVEQSATSLSFVEQSAESKVVSDNVLFSESHLEKEELDFVPITNDDFIKVTGQPRPKTKREFTKRLKNQDALQEYLGTLTEKQIEEFCTLNNDIVSKGTKENYLLLKKQLVLP